MHGISHPQAVPVEIWDYIFDFIDQSASKCQTYCSLTRTCSFLYTCCIPRLYRTIKIEQSWTERAVHEIVPLYLLARSLLRGAASTSYYRKAVGQSIASNVEHIDIRYFSYDRSSSSHLSNVENSCDLSTSELRTIVKEVSLPHAPRRVNMQQHMKSCSGRNDLCTAWVLRQCLNLKSARLSFTYGPSEYSFTYRVLRYTIYRQLTDVQFDGYYFHRDMSMPFTDNFIGYVLAPFRGSNTAVKKLKLTDVWHLELLQNSSNNRCPPLSGLTELELDNWNVLLPVIQYTPGLKILRIHYSLGPGIPSSVGTVNRGGQLGVGLSRVKETIEELEMSMSCASDPTGAHEFRVDIVHPVNFYDFQHLKHLKIPLPMLFFNVPKKNYLSTVLPPQLETLEVTDDVQGHKLVFPAHYFASLSYLLDYVLNLSAKREKGEIYALQKFRLHLKRPLAINIASGMNLIPAFRAAHVDLMLLCEELPTMTEAERVEFVEGLRRDYNKTENPQE